MDLKEYHKMAEMEENYWWHMGKKSLIDSQLQIAKTKLGKDHLDIINIGCGTGGTVPTMRKHGTIHNADTSDLAIQYCQQRGIENAVHFDGDRLPYEDNSFDVAVALDVLEHIGEDDKALKDWHRVLRPGGMLIITVPAHQWLWSGHDTSLHHFRRYTRQPLANQLSQHGYNIHKSSYAVAFSFPMVVGYRVLEKLTKGQQKTSYVMLPKPINSFFAKLLDVESALLTKISFPIGTSVLSVSEKAVAK